MSYVHQPVLLQEVLANLAIKPEGVYVDGTFGRGGHASAILAQLDVNGRLFAFDKDPAAVAFAQERLGRDKRFSIQQGSFCQIESFMQGCNLLGKVDGILLDLGVSSPQLDDPERGFSFMRDGPLDMRMDPQSGISAAQWLNTAAEAEIAQVIKQYGEERFARRIAAAIVRIRQEQPLETTGQLAKIIADAVPVHDKYKHPATRTFQGIRIYINSELDDLQQGLNQCLEVLAVGGRLLVLTFHSLEDRIVKRFIQQQVQGDIPADIPVRHEQLGRRLRKVGGAIRASEAEIAGNPRSRSATLRVMEKLL